MIGQPRSLKKAFELFRDPVTAEKRRLLADRWSRLDPAVRLPGQGLGRKATGCGATIGIQPRCDFACTGCYLGHEANRIPALPMAAVLAQLDELRRYLGPKSNVQITDGEVTLRPVEELTEILRYARSIGIVPMVMTHGDTLRRQPGLLERLMIEGQLTEISIHVDITQRGREGYHAPKSELELMPLRDEFAAMVREARRRTGRPLRAATTLTVTSDNLPQIADVVRWLVHNRDAFSLVSFQPLAQVGRTRKRLSGVDAASLWREIGKATAGFGLDLPSAEPLHFGHPECTRFVPVLAIERPGEGPRLLQLIRDQPEDVAVMRELFDRGLGGIAFRDDLPVEALARGAGAIRSAPSWFFGPVRRWADGRLRREAGTSLAQLLFDALRGKTRVDGLTLTSHHFMSPEELGTELGKARL
ncbi:MAG TPA: radical SAM protein, partial [Thermoanaerobaculia bacterium]|nr:radical SAM protein [Thermoanaerobaculia bacterium]